MRAALPYLIAAAALATLGMLAAGIVNMSRREQHPRRANILMRWRIGLQATAILLLVLLLVLSGS
ncbi:MAG TPA: twin transmembrane helix small protein [Alphaproteobacteria bacterium]